MVARNEFVEYTLELLADLGAVRARSMFGGYGLYLDDLMFGIIADDVVYFKVDDTNRDIFLSAGLEPFCPPPPTGTTSGRRKGLAMERKEERVSGGRLQGHGLNLEHP